MMYIVAALIMVFRLFDKEKEKAVMTRAKYLKSPLAEPSSLEKNG